MVTASDAPPCAAEAKLWRECLKKFDYGPDRKKGACDTDRFRYYDCIKDWSNKGGHPYDPKKFQVADACAAEALELHDCMKITMFDVERCLPQTLKLKVCSAKQDPMIMASLRENEEVQEALRNEKVLGLKAAKTKLERMWDVITGKE